jgi:hypothetical protein
LPSALILLMATLLPFCQKPFACAISHKNGVWQLIPRPKDCLCTCSLRYIGNGRAMRWGGCDRRDAQCQPSRPRSDRDYDGTNSRACEGQLCSQLFASLPSFARGVLQLMGKWNPSHKRTQSVLNVPSSRAPCRSALLSRHSPGCGWSGCPRLPNSKSNHSTLTTNSPTRLGSTGTVGGSSPEIFEGTRGTPACSARRVPSMQ